MNTKKANDVDKINLKNIKLAADIFSRTFSEASKVSRRECFLIMHK